MQRKVEGSPNVETMLVAVRELRKEREKVKELQTQKTEQRTAIGKISLVKYIPSSNRHYCKNCTVADNNQNSFSFLSSCRSKDCAIGAAVKRFKICSRWCDPRRFASGKQ